MISRPRSGQVSGTAQRLLDFMTGTIISTACKALTDI